MTAPPDEIIRAAEIAAALSPCAKSKRGAVLFVPGGNPREIVATGHNAPPMSVGCDGSDACRASCSKRCVHAEAHALVHVRTMPRRVSSRLDLVHVKIGPDGRLTASGGPSCWQCARDVFDAAIGGVWLYEERLLDRDGNGHVWRRYTASEFWTATCLACEVHP